MGYVAEADEGSYPCGVLVFSVDSGSNGEENLIAAQIHWFYVAKKQRKQGVAEELLRELFRIMEESNVEHILCDIPMSDEYNELCSYLESWGFVISLTDKYEADIPLGDVAKFDKNRNTINYQNIKPLSCFSNSQLTKFFNRMNNSTFDADHFSKKITDYNTQVSCAYVNNGVIDGLLLICGRGEMLEVKLFYSTKNVKQSMLQMFSYSLAEARKKYPDETTVHVAVLSSPSANLVSKMFPELSPRLVRRAYYSVFDFDESFC